MLGATQTAEKSEGKIPFKIRFTAWWEGYDAGAYYAHLQANENSQSTPIERPAYEEKPEPPGEIPFDPWDRGRIDIAQYVWGPGYCGPGGPEHVIAISKLLALSPELSMADIGAGLGGPMRTLADHFGVWITGYEESQALVEAGNELSKMAGMTKKAPLVHYIPTAAFAFERHYDRFLAKEAFHLIDDKLGLLASIEEALKPEGLVLITDYVLNDDAAVAAETYRVWREGEPKTPFMKTREEYAEIIGKAGLSLRVNEDRTKEQLELITQAWKGVDKLIARLKDDEESAHLVDVLVKEAELWSRRVDVMREGQVKLCRFLAAKKENRPSMMSDW